MTFRYIGSKKQLLNFIKEVVNKENNNYSNFSDLFAGTGIVGDYFKNDFKIVSNDLEKYSYVINKCLFEF